MLELEAGHSHLYPGARGRILGTGSGLIRFADGGTATARLEGGSLQIGSYRTAAGREIVARTWAIAIEAGRFQILQRLK